MIIDILRELSELEDFNIKHYQRTGSVMGLKGKDPENAKGSIRLHKRGQGL